MASNDRLFYVGALVDLGRFADDSIGRDLGLLVDECAVLGISGQRVRCFLPNASIHLHESVQIVDACCAVRDNMDAHTEAWFDPVRRLRRYGGLWRGSRSAFTPQARLLDLGGKKRRVLEGRVLRRI